MIFVPVTATIDLALSANLRVEMLSCMQDDAQLIVAITVVLQ